MTAVLVLAAMVAGGAETAQVASAQCADPRGNTYCTNGGQVTFPTPAPAAKPTIGTVNVPNPNAGQSDAPNPNAPVGGPANLSVVVAPASAAAGDTIAIAGKGFTANGRGNLIFVNVVGADGIPFDAQYTPITCVETDNLYLAMLQDLGWGCTIGSSGALIQSGSDGTFRASVTVPPVAAGDAKVCISSVFSNPVCTPLTVQDGGG